MTSPVLITIATILGVALTAGTATILALGLKTKALIDSRIKNDNLRAAADLGLHLFGVLGQEALAIASADLSAGRLDKVVGDVVAKGKSILATEGGDTAAQLLSMGEAYLESLARGALSKLAPQPAPAAV